MLPELLQKTNLFYTLHCIDKELAEKTRQKNCPYCDDTLHNAKYKRKPKGSLDNIPDEYLNRYSLCCRNKDCRCRTLPPSCLFFGRRVYWGCVILIVLTFRQNNPNSASARKIQEIFDINRETLKRWIDYYRDVFPYTPQWQRLRSRIASSVKNNELPWGLLNHFINHFKSAEEGLIECLKFMASDNF